MIKYGGNFVTENSDKGFQHMLTHNLEYLLCVDKSVIYGHIFYDFSSEFGEGFKLAETVFQII